METPRRSTAPASSAPAVGWSQAHLGLTPASPVTTCRPSTRFTVSSSPQQHTMDFADFKREPMYVKCSAQSRGSFSCSCYNHQQRATSGTWLETLVPWRGLTLIASHSQKDPCSNYDKRFVTLDGDRGFLTVPLEILPGHRRVTWGHSPFPDKGTGCFVPLGSNRSADKEGEGRIQSRTTQ